MPNDGPILAPELSRRFAFGAMALAAVAAILPYLWASATTPNGAWYLGFQYASDDQMVYAAWMRQAQDGRFLMDNRFAVDEQPGLTVHLYYFVLGLMSKLTGIPLAMALARALLSALFVWLLYRLILRLNPDTYFVKLALPIGVLGGGVGFLVWHAFGETIVRPAPSFLASYLGGRLPTDVWQPEGFVFPSMLTNDLFMASLCLILGVFLSALAARDSWRPVPVGFACLLVLTNIHSYDVVIVGGVLLGLAGAAIATRTITAQWVVRVLAIGLGAVAPALWFLNVLGSDPVFQARASTETYSPAFRQVLLGYLVLLAVGLVGIWRSAPDDRRRRGALVAALGAVGIVTLSVLSGGQSAGYWMGWPAFAGCVVAALALAALAADPNPARSLTVCWGLVGLALPYLPVLFQRKLAMGLAIPWSLLAAMGLYAFLRASEKGTRILVGALAILVLCGSSALWFQRELRFIRDNVTRTTIHPVFPALEIRRILDRLGEAPGRKVVLAMPGIPLRVAPDEFATPYLPDLNALASGFAGAYAYAGHWSETPDYLRRRAESQAFFMEGTPSEARSDLIRRAGATHLIAPIPEAFPEFFEVTGKALADLRPLGRTLLEGNQFRLIEID